MVSHLFWVEYGHLKHLGHVLVDGDELQLLSFSLELVDDGGHVDSLLIHLITGHALWICSKHSKKKYTNNIIILCHPTPTIKNQYLGFELRTSSVMSKDWTMHIAKDIL